MPERERTRLELCSSEPIRTPGAIQPHGVLLGVDRSTRRIVVTSANTMEFLGVEPERVLDHTVAEVLGDETIPALRESADRGGDPREVVANGRRFDAIVQRDDPVAFVELEPKHGLDDHDVLSRMHAAAHRLGAIVDRRELLDAVTEEFAALTGMDRVMVYHFHDDGHGEVVAETCAAGMEPYAGLHFPASDIPVQARQLYLTKLSRAIASSDATPVPLLGLPDTPAADLDLTRAELRSVSPFHLQFMRNMGQASSVSFSLIQRGELAGMITCAHRTERRLPYLVRRSLEVLANQIALQLRTIADVSRLEHEVQAQRLRTRLLRQVISSDDIAGAVLSGDFTLLDVLASDAAIVRMDGTTSRTAGAPTSSSIDQALAELGDVVSSSVQADLPHLAPILAPYAGLLVRRIGADGFLALLREEVIQSVDWLGDLAEQNRAELLSPRLSFSAWTQSVTGTSLPWRDVPHEADELARDLDDTLLRREQSRLATLAMRDPLTGLGNRRSLMLGLEDATMRSSHVSLLFIDLDDFKVINDTHGHDAGDHVIIEIGRRLVQQTRADDRVARFGGDEFVILCEQTTLPEAEALAARIATSLRSPIGPAAHTVTASIGIVECDADTPAEEMIARADAAMYRAKQNGRDRISV